jgi:hypothetical protein
MSGRGLFYIASLVLMLPCFSWASPATDKIRAFALDATSHQEAALDLERRLSSYMVSKGSLSTSAVEMLSVGSAAVNLLRKLDQLQLVPETLEWLFGSDRRLVEFSWALSDSDRLTEVGRIMNELCAADPEERDRFFRLMVALAVVWDQPQRPSIHHQMGNQPLAYQSDVLARYQFFKEVYSERHALVDFDTLRLFDLLFVVDTPVPISELEWAREHIKSRRLKWAEQYTRIVYDMPRLNASQYQWPNGVYTLASILKQGGICVDQAYFATIGARAFGIPAVQLSGSGSGTAHAWFGYLRSAGKWELDVARYENSGYTTGYAVMPQTGSRISDHQILYDCDPVFYTEKFDKAHRLSSLALVLLRTGQPERAIRLTKKARREAPKFIEPWETECAALLALGEEKKAISLLEAQAAEFRKYDDLYVQIRIKQARLVAGQDADAAQRILRETLSRVRKERDDLASVLSFELAKGGESVKEKMTQLERTLRSQRESGTKNYAMLLQYMELAETDAEKKTVAQFIDKYVEKMIKEQRIRSDLSRNLLGLVQQAYQRAGDERKAQNVSSQIADLKK